MMVGEPIAGANAAARESWRYPQYRIKLFAKPPLPGQVKTRFRALFDDERCVALHTELLEYGLGQLLRPHLAPLTLCVTEPHPYFDTLRERHAMPLELQRGADLGARMAHAVETGLQAHQAVLLIGADCPFVDVDYLQSALDALNAGERVVIGPALDGGYVLLALAQPIPAIFADMPWGGDRVLALTRERLAAAGVAWRELPPCADIDRPEDLGRLRQLPAFAHW